MQKKNKTAVFVAFLCADVSCPKHYDADGQRRWHVVARCDAAIRREDGGGI